jgi:hypothetical protein
MNTSYIIGRVKDLAAHAEAAQNFAWTWGRTLNALWKATGNSTAEESLEVSFKEREPGSFEIYRRLKGGGDDGFDDVVRLACGSVLFEQKIVFNSRASIPECLMKFFQDTDWKVSKEQLVTEVQ